MKKPKPQPLKIAPATIKYKKGKPTVEFTITNTRLEDWFSKAQLQANFDIKSRSLQTLRDTNRIVSTKLGRKIYYYIPAFLFLLENNIYYK